MNKILKATHSHYISQRDILIAELELMLNSSTSHNAVNNVINTIERLAITNTCINTVEAIIEDNPSQSPQSISELLAKRLTEQSPENYFDEENQKDKEE